MADYNAIEQEQIKKNQQYAAQQAATMRENANSYINELNSAVDVSAQPVIDNLNKSKANVADQYKSLYDANAVQELINRRQVQESMANMGLTDSGLNRSQQTALALQRGNADLSVRSQEQAAIDQIAQQTAEYLAQIAAQKQQNSANVLNSLNSNINSLNQNAYQTAIQNAATQYNAQLQAETEQYNAQLEAEAAKAKADAEAQNEASKQMWERYTSILENNLNVDKLRAQKDLDPNLAKTLGTYYTFDENWNIVASATKPNVPMPPQLSSNYNYSSGDSGTNTNTGNTERARAAINLWLSKGAFDDSGLASKYGNYTNYIETMLKNAYPSKINTEELRWLANYYGVW